MKYIFLKLSFIFLLGTLQCTSQIDTKALELLKKIDSAVQSSGKMEFKVRLFARMKEENYKQVAFFRINREPLKIYYQQYLRNPIELLYDETQNKKKALVNPGMFPFTNIRLSPYSSLILKRQHHSIFEADPAYMLNEIFYMLKTFKTEESKLFVRDSLINSAPCKVLEYRNRAYKIKKATVTRDTDLLTFARKHHVNFYSLIIENDDLSLSSDLKKRMQISVPSSYARKIVLTVSPSEAKIRDITVYDQYGIFESYHYIYFKNNRVFVEGTFDAENPDYNF